jgi:hypothetical protein
MLQTVAMLAGVALFAPLPKQTFNSVVAIGRTMPDGFQSLDRFRFSLRVLTSSGS